MRRGESKLIEFIDKTSTQAGTQINRVNLMAAQGMGNGSVTFNSDGTITETNLDGHTLKTEFLADGSIKETFTGTKTVVLTTTFSGNTITKTTGAV